MGTEGSFPGVKRQGREAGRSHVSGAEVKNGGAINLTPSYVFMAWCLIKPTDDLIDGTLSLTTVLISGSEVRTPAYIEAVCGCL
jgi:hypothetical protein